MSRKPTAIRLSKSGTDKSTSLAEVATSAEIEKPNSHSASKSKANSNSKSSIKTKSTKSITKRKTARSPKVMPAPKLEDKNYDPFDQSPFVKHKDAVNITTHLPDMSKGIRWGSILLAAICALFSIGFSYWIFELVAGFFELNPVLGWVAFGLSIIFAIALIALVLRELLAIRSLRKIGNLRQDAEQVLLGNQTSKLVLRKVTRLYTSRPDMHWYLDELSGHDADIMDEADKIKLAENTLMKPLDEEAKQIIAGTAKRVSVITALNPSAVLDILFVGYQVLGMLRKLMALYGGRPAFFSALKLVRMVATHLAITGGLAVSDTILQQVLGKGIAGTLSRKIGEGTVNGIMATRIGIAAIDLCRPLPFTTLEQPNLKGFISQLIGVKSD